MSTLGPGSPSFSVIRATLTDPQAFPSSAAANETEGRGGGGGGGGGGGTTSSSLYLFTFLATLLLLLVVSFTIVVRSFVMRRRYRRRLEEALAEGYVLPQFHGPGRKDFGEKPKLWDRRIFVSTEEQWQGLNPLSAKLIYNAEAISDAKSANSRSLSEPRDLGIFNNLLGYSARRHRQPSPNNPSPNSPSLPSLTPNQEPIGIQISILIAMPSKGSKFDSVEEFPEMALGVGHLPYTDNSPVNSSTME